MRRWRVVQCWAKHLTDAVAICCADVTSDDVKGTQKRQLSENKSIEQKYLLMYHFKTKLSSCDVYIILADIYEQLYSWTFKFRKVMRQHIWGEVANFIPSFSVAHLRMQEWKNYCKETVLSQGNRAKPQLLFLV